VSERHLEILRLLADGAYHSGELIASRLGISRAAVSKAMRRVSGHYGVAVETVHGRGYRLSRPLELLDAGTILAGLSAAAPHADSGTAKGRVARLEIHDQIQSTNGYLMAEAAAGAPSGTVCLAERQTAGRGRRGRPWVSPFGCNLYLSILWRYPLAPAALGGASLAAGVVVARVLRDLGISDLGLKWPNDLIWRRHKLGGLLLEVAGEAQGPSHLVVGLGLNLDMDQAQGRAIDQPWAALTEALGGACPGRNHLAARLIASLTEALEGYGQGGLTPFLDDWERFDLLRGERVRLEFGGRVIEGEHLGIAPDGALRLGTLDGVQTFHGGEISLRPLAPLVGPPTGRAPP